MLKKKRFFNTDLSWLILTKALRMSMGAKGLKTLKGESLLTLMNDV